LVKDYFFPTKAEVGGEPTDDYKSAGFNSHDAFDNLQYFLFLIASLVVGVLLMIIGSIISRYRRKITKKLRKLKKEMMWNGII
jgi:hypothetical protein